MTTGRALRGIALAGLCSAAGLASAAAAVRMPVPDGTYCGPENATIAVDSRTDTVSIDGYTCGFPIFAADKLQSIKCRQPGDSDPKRREFDVRVLNGALLYNGHWFKPCRP